MAENDSESLIDAFVNVRADTKQAEKDILWFESFIKQHVEKPATVSVKADDSIKRTASELDSTADAADRASKAVSGVGDATSGIDDLFNRIHRMRGEIDHATKSQERFNKTAASASSGGGMLGGLRRGAGRFIGGAVGMASAPLIGAAGLAGTLTGQAQNMFGRFAAGGAVAGAGVRLAGGGMPASIGGALGGGVGNAIGGLAGPGAGRVAGAALGTAGAIAGKVIGDGIGEIQDARKNEAMMTRILGDAKQAKELFKELSAIDLKVPISMPQLADSAKTLALAGFEASEIPKKMQVIMDAASASTEGLAGGTDRIVAMLSRIKGQGQVMGQELMQLQRMGLPIADIMKAQFGKTIQEVAKATREGTLESGKVIDGILAGLNAKFAGAVSEEINTIGGQIELLKAKYSAFSATIAEPVFDPLLDGLKHLNTALESPGFQEFIKNITRAVAATMEMVRALKQLSDQSGATDTALGAAVDTSGYAADAWVATTEVITGVGSIIEDETKMGGLESWKNFLFDNQYGRRDSRQVEKGVGPMLDEAGNDMRYVLTPEQRAAARKIQRANEFTAVGQSAVSGVMGGLGMMGGVAGDLMGQAGTAFSNATGISSVADARKMASAAALEAEKLNNKESVARRVAREKADRDDADGSRQNAARKMLGDRQAEIAKDIADPRLKEAFLGSKFDIEMKRDKETGRMEPVAELKEAFKDMRGSTQTSGLDGLNRMMQGQVDAANDRKMQQDQKTLLEKIVTKLQEQINLEVKAPGDGAAVIAPG